MYLITYLGDGTATEFNFSFPYFQAADVHVSVNSVIQTSGACTVIPTSETRVDGKYMGGRVILTTAPVAGAEIRIWRKIDLSRVIDYQPTLPINTDCLNADFNFMLEYLRDLYELDGDVENIENGLQFLDSIQYQIEQLGDFSELARKADLPDFTQFAKLTDIPDTSEFAAANHTHDMSAYVTNTALAATISELQDEIDDIDTSLAFPIEFAPDDEPDVVVKTQLPTAENNYTWYRLYKSGWVEQGGRGGALENSAKIITLPIAMADTNFYASMINMVPATPVIKNYNSIGLYIPNNTQVRFATLATVTDFAWYITGMSAQSDQ
ncbi:MAG: hypothetical protein IAC77_02530 [Proteobacteria bacterium]|uniref:Uncharacterized protein n=1 Tax=Candidatus Enterousia excrementavium TaxID=2840789 RepID=A0A940ICD4_9PROT|nr:hypothetical protein [Candidatus Enterousia excrementavium]